MPTVQKINPCLWFDGLARMATAAHKLTPRVAALTDRRYSWECACR